MPRGRPRKFPSLAELRSMITEGRRTRTRLLKERKKLQARMDPAQARLAAAGAG